VEVSSAVTWPGPPNLAVEQLLALNNILSSVLDEARHGIGVLPAARCFGGGVS
jgi:hypothetical protein